MGDAREILLNPGPVTLSEGVRAALTGPDLCHREQEYSDLQDSVRRRLLAVYELDPINLRVRIVSLTPQASFGLTLTS